MSFIIETNLALGGDIVCKFQHASIVREWITIFTTTATKKNIKYDRHNPLRELL